MNYFFILIIILVVVIVKIYTNRKKKQTFEFLKLLKSKYPNRIEANGKAKFSSIHILTDVELNILYSKRNLLIYGFDYYRHRKTMFIFYSDQNIEEIKIPIPKYSITNIAIFEGDKIVLTSENDCEIILFFKRYGKENKELQKEKFIELLNKIEH